jgi:MSHA biogenesis protein MshJ
MKQLWLRISSKIDALGLRERVVVFLMAVVILGALVNSAILDQKYAEENELSQQIAQDQSQIAGIQTEIRGKLANYDSHPDAAKIAQLNQLKQKLAQMHASLQDMQKGLVSPDRMATLLEDILKQNGRLKLVSLRTIPASALNESDAVDKSKSAVEAAQKLVDNTAKTEQARVDGKEKIATPPSLRNGVYKHGVEIVIEGDYLDMVSYMTALEAMPWQLFWGKASLSADDSPKRSLTLTLYTLSMDKKWLNI